MYMYLPVPMETILSSERASKMILSLCAIRTVNVSKLYNVLIDKRILYFRHDTVYGRVSRHLKLIYTVFGIAPFHVP